MLAFRDAAKSMHDAMLSAHDMGYGMDPKMAKEDWGSVHPFTPFFRASSQCISKMARADVWTPNRDDSRQKS